MTDAKQFDGTVGNAKDIAAWCGGDEVAIWGGPHRLPPHDDDGSWQFDASRSGGLNILEVLPDGSLFHHDVPKDSWVVKSGDDHVIYSDKQYQAAFGQK
jgi:hypothetical protein